MDDFPLKGAFVEVGAALSCDIPVVIVAKDCHSADIMIGSWIYHPLVRFAKSVDQAFEML